VSANVNYELDLTITKDIYLIFLYLFKFKNVERGCKMKKGQIWTIVGISLVVAVIASVATASITGNVIKLNQDRFGKFDVYTKAEVDAAYADTNARIDALSGGASGEEQYFIRAASIAYDSAKDANVTDIQQWKNGTWVTIKDDAQPGDSFYINDMRFTIKSVTKYPPEVKIHIGTYGGYLMTVTENTKFNKDIDEFMVISKKTG
jgi:hypothetical protein